MNVRSDNMNLEIGKNVYKEIHPKNLILWNASVFVINAERR